jgi:hypothetical protein
MLTLRLIGPNDYTAHEDGQRIGRIQYTRDRSSGLWLWNVTVTIAGPPFGDAATLDEAKGRFKVAWEAFKLKHGPGKLAKAYAAMNAADRPERYGR